MLRNLFEDDFKQSKYVLIDNEMYIQKQYRVEGDYTNLLTEIQSLNSIYLKKIKDIKFENNKTIYYEQYVQGVTLDNIDFNTLTINEIKYIFEQIVTGLLQLHEIDLIHRDIKPQNILINEYNNIKIIDYDIVRKVSEFKDKDTVLLGTNKYASPEHFGFGETTISSDIYSFGMTINELLSSTKHYSKFKHIIKYATNINSNKRFKNFNEVKKALENVKTGSNRFTTTVNLISLFDIIIINTLIFVLIYLTEETTNFVTIISYFIVIYLSVKILNSIKYSNKSFLIYVIYCFILIVYYATTYAIYEMLYI